MMSKNAEEPWLNDRRGNTYMREEDIMVPFGGFIYHTIREATASWSKCVVALEGTLEVLQYMAAPVGVPSEYLHRYYSVTQTYMSHRVTP